jgi:predicted Zn-dependent peptidase
VAALVGDFRADQAVSLIDKYFSDWRGEPLPGQAPGGEAARREAASPAATTGSAGGAAASGDAAGAAGAGGSVGGGGAAGALPRRVEVKFPSQPYLLMAFNKPVYPHPDAVKFQVLDELLNGGRSSLLQRRLVVERQVALDLFTFEGPGQRRDNLFIIGAVPQAPHFAAEVESAILEELAVIAARPIPEKDLQKVRNRVQASFIRGLASNSGLASQLTYFQILYGDWKQLLRLLEQADKVTAADLQQIVTRYLAPDRRVTGELVTQEEGAAAPVPPAPETRP